VEGDAVRLQAQDGRVEEQPDRLAGLDAELALAGHRADGPAGTLQPHVDRAAGRMGGDLPELGRAVHREAPAAGRERPRDVVGRLHRVAEQDVRGADADLAQHDELRVRRDLEPAPGPVQRGEDAGIGVALRCVVDLVHRQRRPQGVEGRDDPVEVHQQVRRAVRRRVEHRGRQRIRHRPPRTAPLEGEGGECIEDQIRGHLAGDGAAEQVACEHRPREHRQRPHEQGVHCLRGSELDEQVDQHLAKGPRRGGRALGAQLAADHDGVERQALANGPADGAPDRAAHPGADQCAEQGADDRGHLGRRVAAQPPHQATTVHEP
jgi:hypothetical protein